ncbi:hypothetical protein NE237_014854 [Protea cynaroides]|uniref:Uncharacterized protein n=1 Tax=Protea cynaroides TaxID=273540 RepID=A0A9Q0KCS7_9MAGN|nr:hypothetical protein NE237_014854 [Protea cynaroides]
MEVMPDPVDAAPPMATELSFHALAGHRSPTTLQFTENIAGSPVQVLVDSGITHNFVQSRIACHLGLPIESAARLTILVGNGTTLHSEGLVCNLAIKFPSHITSVDALVLPLFSADLVLGV